MLVTKRLQYIPISPLKSPTDKYMIIRCVEIKEWEYNHSLEYRLKLLTDNSKVKRMTK